MFSKLARCFMFAAWLVPALLMWAAFPPLGEKFDIIFALAPLLWAARRPDRRKAVRILFFNGLAFWLATLSWMPAIVKNGGPWPLVALGWFALAAYCAAYFAAFGFLSCETWRWARRGAYWRRLFAILVAEPVLWAGLELVRSRFGGGFSWNQAGVPIVNAGFSRLASFGGVYLVSAATVLIAGTLASAADRIADSMRKIPAVSVPRWLRSLETLLPMAVVFALHCIPSPSPVAKADSAVTVALVQRNFPCAFASGDREDPATAYRRLFAAVSALKPDLVVLPESAMGEFGAVDSPRAAAFARAALSATGADAILAGGSRRDAEKREYNSAALYTPGGLAAVYDKVHLVPFGEFIPLDKVFTALQRLAPVGSCSPGELKTLEMGGLKLGVAICYEDTDSAQARRLAADGAQMLVFITNDSWFSHSEETVQHAWQARARAVETGLPVVRCANSGVTGVISQAGTAEWLVDANGKALVDSQGTFASRVMPSDGVTTTPYVALGDLPLALAFLAVLALLATDAIVRRKTGLGL